MNVEQASSQHPLNPQETAAEAPASDADLQKAEAFLRDVAPHLGRLFGMDLSITIGGRWQTNMETGEVTADPRFFVERGYTPDMSVYATLHEVAAHLRELATEPRLTEKVIAFVKQGKAQSIFHNVFSDIAGNNLIHAVLPKTMPDVAEQLYRDKLFQETDYSEIEPRHLQFLYKLIRQEMVPDSQTIVLPEVNEAIAGLRDYQGKGDLVKYSTAVARSRREIMRPDEKFRIWTELIYPVYEKLLEQDKKDPIDSGGSGEGSGEADRQGDSNQQDEPSPEQQPQDAEAGQGQFDKYYEDYFENRHPEPLSEEAHDEIHQHARQSADPKQERKSSWHSRIQETQKVIDEQIRRETGGHTLADQRRYNAEIKRWQNEIAQMRDVYKKVIQERIAQKRGLGRKALPEGAILDPNRLAQTVIDIKSGVDRPEAFLDYEQRRGHVESVGKTDYVFIFDVSGSMADDGKSQATASSAVIGLEGLAAMQRDIEEAEEENNIDLELDIRTAIYTFGVGARLLKPLSNTLHSKERFDAYAAVSSPGDSDTQDFLALEAIEKLEADRDRRQIAIVV
jgi:hypothetical protein